MLAADVTSPNLGNGRDAAVTRSVALVPVGKLREDPAEKPLARRLDEAAEDKRAAIDKEETKPEPPARPIVELGSRARLAYDQELSQLFVEILDPETGDVVDRFPPEKLVEHVEQLVERAGFGDAPNGTLFDKVA